MIKKSDDRRRVDEPPGCELQGGGRQYRIVRIKGLKTRCARKCNVTGEASTIFPPEGAFLNIETNKLVIPSGATIKERNHLTTDVKSWGYHEVD